MVTLTPEQAVALGWTFFEQTRQLAINRPHEAETALKHSLIQLVNDDVNPSHSGLPYCEWVFCERISRVAVAWMAASGGLAEVPTDC